MCSNGGAGGDQIETSKMKIDRQSYWTIKVSVAAALNFNERRWSNLGSLCIESGLGACCCYSGGC